MEDNVPPSSKCCLFVGDLSIFCSEADLTRAFEPYGVLVEVKIMRCEETHKNLCYGFVKFEDAHAAIVAMKQLNGSLLCGRPMRVSWATHKLKRSVEDSNDEDTFDTSSSSIHVTYITSQINHIITEELLQLIFQKFGRVQDITVKKFEIDKVSNTQRGYGFVHFPPSKDGILAAIKCTDEMRDCFVDGINFRCDISHKLLKQLYHMRDISVRRLLPARVLLEIENWQKSTKAGKNKQRKMFELKGTPKGKDERSKLIDHRAQKLTSKSSFVSPIYMPPSMNCSLEYFEQAGFTFIGQYGLNSFPLGSVSTETMCAQSVDNYFLPNLSCSADNCRLSTSSNTDSDSGETTSVVSFSEVTANTGLTSAGISWNSFDHASASNWSYTGNGLVLPIFSYPTHIQNHCMIPSYQPISSPRNNLAISYYDFTGGGGNIPLASPSLFCPMMFSPRGNNQQAPTY